MLASATTVSWLRLVVHVEGTADRNTIVIQGLLIMTAALEDEVNKLKI